MFISYVFSVTYTTQNSVHKYTYIYTTIVRNFSKRDAIGFSPVCGVPGLAQRSLSELPSHPYTCLAPRTYATRVASVPIRISMYEEEKPFNLLSHHVNHFPMIKVFVWFFSLY